MDDPLDAFTRAYPLDDARAAIGPWTIARVAAGRVRAGVEIALAHPRGDQLTISIESRAAGAPHLVATAQLALSYYADAGVDHAAAAQVTRALAAALARHEPAAPRFLPVLHGGGRVVELRINRACNERCRFCNTPADSPTIVDDRDAILGRIADAARAGCRELLLTGRETTLDPHLPDYLRAARAAGIAVRRVQTNGTTVHHPPLLTRLCDAGLNAVEVSLHTFDADTFDALIGSRGLLAHAIAGLDALAARRDLSIHLVTVATALNAAELPSLVARVADRWPAIRTWTLSPVAPVGDGAAALELLLPYDQLAPHLAAALAVARDRGVRATIPARCGLPPCALPVDARAHHAALTDGGPPREPGKRKPARCTACTLDDRCAGAWTAYLDRHGDAALVPIA